MPESFQNKLIILSGPSCVGKSPLVQSLKKMCPQLLTGTKELVAYNSRRPRPKEREGIDYYFRSKAAITRLGKKPNFIGMTVRQDAVAVNLDELKNNLRQHDVLFEGNPIMGKALFMHKSLKRVKKVNAFLSPVSKEEILYWRSLDPPVDVKEMITDIMRRKLLRRTQRQKGILGLPDLENIEIRAKSAYGEMKMAQYFDHVIVNHDGEDSDHWDAFYFPLGEARKAVMAFANVIKGRKVIEIEHWERNTLE